MDNPTPTPLPMSEELIRWQRGQFPWFVRAYLWQLMPAPVMTRGWLILRYWLFGMAGCSLTIAAQGVYHWLGRYV